jgi:hypothetical protein
LLQRSPFSGASFMARILLQASVFLALFLAACSHGGSSPAPMTPVQPVTIADPIAYLAQSQNLDGNTAMPLHRDDPLTYRRFDIGHYQASDSFLLPDGSAIIAVSFMPFGPFNPANGDGGDHYVVEADAVRIAATQDGGTPGVQYFVGKACGGDGWLLFKTDATNEWKETVARLSESPDPSSCNGATLVSEHYDGPDFPTSHNAERFFLARGWGRLAWQAFGDTPPAIDLSTRCPDFGFNVPPVPGWYLRDCRIATMIEPANGTLTGLQLWRP